MAHIGSSHLFVYGTLMRDAKTRLGARERSRLARETVFGGAAMANGVLLDLGGYPGLIRGGGSVGVGHDSAVHGEVLRLLQPAATFGWLDIYEDVAGVRGGSGEYRRDVIDVQLAGGARLPAWAYVLVRTPKRGLPIPAGRWPTSMGVAQAARRR